MAQALVIRVRMLTRAAVTRRASGDDGAEIDIRFTDLLWLRFEFCTVLLLCFFTVFANHVVRPTKRV